MKHRFYVILSLAGVTLLVLIQAYIITQVYRLKVEEFDARNRSYIQEGIAVLNSSYGSDGFDSVIVYLDRLAYYCLSLFDTVSGPAGRNQAAGFTGAQFHRMLSEEETLTAFLKQHLAGRKVDTSLVSGIYLRKLDLLENDSLEIISNGMDRKAAFYNKHTFINTYLAEGNYYRTAFDYYLDFSHRQGIILRSMAGIFLLSLFSILSVAVIFLITVYNLIRQSKLSDLKTDFINNITHELKTPLTTIAVAAQSISSEQFVGNRQKVQELSGIISRQNKYLSHLINNVLDISFWDKRGVMVQKRQMDAFGFLDDYLKAYQLRTTEQAVRIERKLKEGASPVEADPAQLTAVLNNLMDNAIKYSGEEPHLVVESAVDEHWQIRVTDHGQGIGKEDLKKIFTKFYRGSGTAKKNVRGLGLGLYNSRRIVEAMGGKISVESNPGKGSTFIINLPVK